jgi:putative NADH-flavin reductase
MKLTIFGANGKVGQIVVTEALRRGHEVTAFVHSSSSFADNPNLRIVKGDVHSQSDIRTGAEGSEAIISALGSWHTPSKDIVTSAVHHLIPIMKTLKIRRIVTVTGAGALLASDHPNIFDRLQHFVIKLAAPKILFDGEEHMRLLSESDLAWTVVRSPVMNTKGSTGYQLGLKYPLPWQTINRAAVARCLLDLAESADWSKQAPVITRP